MCMRIRDLTLSLTQHKRSLVDGSVEPPDAPTGATGGAPSRHSNHNGGRGGRSTPVADDERHIVVQCRFPVPVRGLSAMAVKTTDRTAVIDIKQLLLNALHELPEPARPPDAVLATCGSRYYQRHSRSSSGASGGGGGASAAVRPCVSTDPRQVLFFVDDQDECLADDASLFDLGFESPPLISVMCATEHLWLRLRGFPERYCVPWHPHMTECDLAKEVHGALRPYDMRMCRAVFYRDDAALRRQRKWRRPATELPPPWRSGSVFGAYEDEDEDATAAALDSGTAAAGSGGPRHCNNNAAPREPVVIPLHEWCRMPAPAPTRMDPSVCVAALRDEAARARSDLVREALVQARHSWFDVADDVAALAESPAAALGALPKWVSISRKRDGRNYEFRVEFARVRGGEVCYEAEHALGEWADGVVQHCSDTRRGVDGVGPDGTPPPPPPPPPSSSRAGGAAAATAAALPSSDPEAASGNDDDLAMLQRTGQDSRRSVMQVQLLAWIPQLVSTGEWLPSGAEVRVPFASPQLHLPFDDDDEELSPFGRKEIHTLWSVADMTGRYPFLSADYFFHERRANVPTAEMLERLRSGIRAFYAEPLRFSFSPPVAAGGSAGGATASLPSAAPAVEFDITSLPRHVTDYGVANGCEVFVEFFSTHTQTWSNDVAARVHEAMKGRRGSGRGAKGGLETAAAGGGRRHLHDDADEDDGGSTVSRTQPPSNLLTTVTRWCDTSFSHVEAPTSASSASRAAARFKTPTNTAQLSKRFREAAVRAAGFHFVAVRTSRNALLRVPVIFATATVEELLELVFCATGDVPMFSVVVVGTTGALAPPWTLLSALESNPGLLTLRVLRRPRPWFGEDLDSVALATSRKAPHLD